MKAECGWGYGMDIILSLNNSVMICTEPIIDDGKFKYGYISNGSLDLSIKEAKQLIFELQMALQECESLMELQRNIEESNDNN